MTTSHVANRFLERIQFAHLIDPPKTDAEIAADRLEARERARVQHQQNFWRVSPQAQEVRLTKCIRHSSEATKRIESRLANIRSRVGSERFAEMSSEQAVDVGLTSAGKDGNFYSAAEIQTLTFELHRMEEASNEAHRALEKTRSQLLQLPSEQSESCDASCSPCLQIACHQADHLLIRPIALP